MSCFKAYLDAPAADDFEFKDEFLFPPDAAFILIKEDGGDTEMVAGGDDEVDEADG